MQRPAHPAGIGRTDCRSGGEKAGDGFTGYGVYGFVGNRRDAGPLADPFPAGREGGRQKYESPGKKGFFATITMKDPEKLKEKYSKEKEQKQKDLDNLGKIIVILKDFYSFYIYEYFKLLKFSLYDLMKIYANCQLNNNIKYSEFWLTVKIED